MLTLFVCINTVALVNTIELAPTQPVTKKPLDYRQLIIQRYFIQTDFEACYARCNCWSDFPDMGGVITHEVDAQCFLDACWCSYNQNTCPYGTLKTNPWCCTKTEGWRCRDWDCDTDGNCTHRPSFKDLLESMK